MKLRVAVFAVVSLFAAAGSLLVIQTSQSAAYTFDQNRIIDDGIFNNRGAMTAQQIDTFLNKFPSSCISPNNHFAAQDPTGYSPTNGFTYGGNVSAGQVIYDSAEAYDINPQVLIATLQKEQSLVDGTAGCSTLRYAAAAGYGCPDGGTSYNYSGVNLYTINGTTVSSVNGTCVNTSSKVGFTQQVIRAAWLLKFGEERSEGNINWAIIRGNWDNSDDPQSCYAGPMTQGTWQRCPSGGSSYYDGYTTIDGTAVHMDDGATAALYWYTPHFSGNQSFFNIFTNWFGGTTGAGYDWSTTGYTITSLDHNTQYDPNQLQPGQEYLATLEALNTGDATWTNNGLNPVTLGDSTQLSPFCNATWVACNRPAYLQEASVAPGQEGHFVFNFQAPFRVGSYHETFKPVAEFFSWFNDTANETFSITVTSPGTYTWTTTGYAITSLDGSIHYDPGQLSPGQRYLATLEARNTGTATWKNNGPMPVTLGTTDGTSSLCNATWVACNRPAYLQEATVAPGSEGHFVFQFQAPYKVGSYRETFKPVAEFFAWFNDTANDALGIQVVSPGTYSWSTSGYTIYDQTGTTQLNPTQLQINQTYLATISAVNTGTATWLNTGPMPVTLGSTSNSPFCDPSWPACNRPAYVQEASVAPGQTGHFRFLLKTPSATGSYQETFKPVAEFFAWFNDTPNDQLSFTAQ